MSKKSILFIVLLLTILIITFCSHIFALHYKQLPLFENKIILSYILNYVAAIIIFIVLERYIKKESSQVGFIFMAGSGLKFLLFFLIFYPSYKADGKMATVEFISFFIPYAICLILEVAYLSKELNNQVFSSKKPE
ncbi:DUF6168 family protein [Patiriisocius marinus]|uniref:DUF6168 family protein n=1 Tax=Patiriisocius marinus TaxID=1397112 RepID=UPI0034D26D40